MWGGVSGRPEYRIALGLTSAARGLLAAFNPTLVHIATPDVLGFQVRLRGDRAISSRGHSVHGREKHTRLVPALFVMASSLTRLRYAPSHLPGAGVGGGARGAGGVLIPHALCTVPVVLPSGRAGGSHLAVSSQSIPTPKLHHPPHPTNLFEPSTHQPSCRMVYGDGPCAAWDCMASFAPSSDTQLTGGGG
jgi:hypothetical protein